jgi:hypothetical protein
VPAASEFSEDSAKGGKIDQNSRQPQELYYLIFVQLQLQVVVPNVVPMNGNLELPPSAKAPFFSWHSICIYTGVGYKTLVATQVKLEHSNHNFKPERLESLDQHQI